MSTHVPGFQSFFRFLHNFILAKLATSSIRVNIYITGMGIDLPHYLFLHVKNLPNIQEMMNLSGFYIFFNHTSIKFVSLNETSNVLSCFVFETEECVELLMWLTKK